MPIVTVKAKYQIVIPKRIREKMGVVIGDILEVKVERGRITLTPKSLVDCAIAEGLRGVRRGHVKSPFDTAAPDPE